MLRFIFFLILCYLLYRLIRGLLFLSAKNRRDIVSSHKVPDEDEMMKDPYCELYIPKRDACPAKIRGEVLFFCSKECLEKYRRERI